MVTASKTRPTAKITFVHAKISFFEINVVPREKPHCVTLHPYLLRSASALGIEMRITFNDQHAD